MAKSNIDTVLNQALATQLGIAIVTSNYNTALAMRRKFYAFRERLRRSGNTEFDELSFIAKPNGELHLIRRAEAISSQVPTFDYTTRQLENSDCPKNIIARGKHKPGLISEAMMQGLLNIKLLDKAIQI